jgi:NAD(P)-dependent dehydrogenase (short-subunit alcohol dehydrogenase family)
MRKILILGGNSDIGISLINKLIKKKYDLHVHYNKKFVKTKLISKIKLIKQDLSKINSKNLNNIFDKDYDIIINLVGYVSNQSFLQFDIQEIQKTILINSLIPFLIIRQSIKNMVKKKYGRIINTSSVGVKFGGGSKTFSYSLSKHINEFIPGDIRKISSNNILYNVLRIGVVNTKLHKKIKNKSLRQRLKLIPLKKMAKVSDISNYINFLISDNNFITNEIINITGGE